MNKAKKLTLCVFIDAFGWEIVQKHKFLDDILTVKSSLGTVLGYSATCVPTILTGQLPRKHGHLSFFFYSPETSPFRLCKIFGLLPKWLTSRARVRNIISRFLKKCFGYTGYFHIYNIPFKHIHLFDYSEKNDIYERDGINGGVPTIFDYMRDNSIPFHKSNWRLSEQENVDAVLQDVKKGEVKFAYLYFGGLDGQLHLYGTDHPNIDKKIKWYDENLREVLAEAHKKYEKVEINVFSDHGMHNTTESYDLISQIEATGLEFGKDYAAAYDSTLARFWFISPESRSVIEEALKKEKCGRILSDQELHDYGVDFPDKKYGDLIYLMNSNVLIVPSFMGERPITGMHGYDPNDKDSAAIFLSNQQPEKMPQRLDDLYDLMVRGVTSD